MTQEAAERLARLAVPSESRDVPSQDLLAGAHTRTQRALEAAARREQVPQRRRARLAVRPGLAVLAAVALLAVAGFTVWRVWPHDPAVLVSVAEDGGGQPSADTAATEPTEVLVVHVVGQVRDPGVVRLTAGARVADAIDAAGGATEEADLAAVNLARSLGDGEQVLVPGVGDAVPAGPGLLDLNTAGLDELEDLPGIGPVLAARILAWRTEHGRFTSVDELAEVSGIGPSLLSGLRDLVRV